MKNDGIPQRFFRMTVPQSNAALWRSWHENEALFFLVLLSSWSRFILFKAHLDDSIVRKNDFLCIDCGVDYCCYRSVVWCNFRINFLWIWPGNICQFCLFWETIFLSHNNWFSICVFPCVLMGNHEASTQQAFGLFCVHCSFTRH